ncbi:MAG: right-handed parallel beta-helix repeat-containing protein [Candidatus Eisenbacteria bacterium]
MRSVLTFGALLAYPHLAVGAVLSVGQSGTEDYASVSEALLAAQDGDRIEVYSGYYYEGESDGSLRLVFVRDIDFSLVGVQDGVVIEGLYLLAGGESHRTTTYIEGLAFVGEAPVFTQALGTATVENCSFQDLDVVMGLGVLDMYAGGNLFLRGCSFSGIHAGADAGVVEGYNVTVEDCQFDDCDVGLGLVWGGHPRLDHVVASHNTAKAIVYASTIEATNCTFWMNQTEASLMAPNEYFFLGIVASHVIHVGDEGDVFADAVNAMQVDCCDLVNGDLVAGLYVGSTNVFSADPLFCDPEGGDFKLEAGSPCLPGVLSPDCDLMGAVDGLCPGLPIVRGSWGSVKAMFR